MTSKQSRFYCNNWWCVLCVLFVCFLCYFESLDGDFTFDDQVNWNLETMSKQKQHFEIP